MEKKMDTTIVLIGMVRNGKENAIVTTECLGMVGNRKKMGTTIQFRVWGLEI